MSKRVHVITQKGCTVCKGAIPKLQSEGYYTSEFDYDKAASREYDDETCRNIISAVGMHDKDTFPYITDEDWIPVMEDREWE